jgi:hypothetical protein
MEFPSSDLFDYFYGVPDRGLYPVLALATQ